MRSACRCPPVTSSITRYTLVRVRVRVSSITRYTLVRVRVRVRP